MLNAEVAECGKRWFVMIAIQYVKIFVSKSAIPSLPLRQVCTTFATNPLPAQYAVRSQVSSEMLEMFLSALNGEAIEVTKANFKELSVLCDECLFELDSPPLSACTT
jgi:hypothetical protein